MKTAFYPGAGRDIFPPIKFPQIKEWYYVVSQPSLEHGDIIFEGSYRSKFMKQLIVIMKINGFININTQENLYIFNNKEREQIIYYETNFVFPRDLKEKHYNCDALVLCGFDYERHEIVNKYSNIITNNITCHDQISDENILLSKNVYTMVIDKDWEYWETKRILINNIENFIKIENRFIKYDE